MFLMLALACSNKPEPPRPEPPPSTEHAAVPAAEPLAEVAPEPADQPPERAPARQAQRGRPVEVVLRSSPPGATAVVDGKLIGPTPVYWAGEADGRAREFTFSLRGYAPARYRFVPITSGVVHARLEVLADEAEPGAAPVRAPLDAASRAPGPHGGAPPDAGAPSASAPSSGAGPQP